jgi:ribosomal protein L37E
VRSDELFGGTTGSGYDKPFGVERGSGYEPKAIATQSPLVCPRCGKPCAGTAERKTCASCGFSTVAQQAEKATANQCPKCSQPLSVIGDSKRCNACGWTLQSEPASGQRRTLPVS